MNQNYLSQEILLLGIYLKEIIRDEIKDSCARMFILKLYRENGNKCPTIRENNHFNILNSGILRIAIKNYVLKNI